MNWKCAICGDRHTDIPVCVGVEAPWRFFVPEDEFAQRVQLNADMCVVDERQYYIRGHIEIPIHGHAEPLALSVWSSLSERSMAHMSGRWEAPDRASDPPYFGWLCSWLPLYPKTMDLQLSVQSRPPGRIPLFTLEPSDHPLALDQRDGISIERWHEIAHQIVRG